MTSTPRLRVLMGVYNPIDYDTRVQREAAALAEHHDVHVVSIDTGHPLPATPYQNVRVPLPDGQGPAPLRQWKRLRAFGEAFLDAARRLGPDVVHAHDFTMAKVGRRTARAQGARLVYDAHELIVPGPRALREPRKERPRRHWYREETRTVRAADLVVAANPERAERMADHYRISTPTVVANHSAPPAEGPMADPTILERFPALKRLRAHHEHVLVYQGDINAERGLDRFVLALDALPDDIGMVLIGGGKDLARFSTLSETDPYHDRLLVLGRVPSVRLPGLLPHGDLGIVTYPLRGLNNILCAPNKIHEYSQAGLPCVASPQPPLKRMIDDTGIGQTVPAPDGTMRLDPIAIARTIEAMLPSLETYRARLGPFLAAHDWATEAARLVDAYADLARVPARETRAPAANTGPIAPMEATG